MLQRIAPRSRKFVEVYQRRTARPWLLENSVKIPLEYQSQVEYIGCNARHDDDQIRQQFGRMLHYSRGKSSNAVLHVYLRAG